MYFVITSDHVRVWPIFYRNFLQPFLQNSFSAWNNNNKTCFSSLLLNGYFLTNHEWERKRVIQILQLMRKLLFHIFRSSSNRITRRATTRHLYPASRRQISAFFWGKNFRFRNRLLALPTSLPNRPQLVKRDTTKPDVKLWDRTIRFQNLKFKIVSLINLFVYWD